MRSFTCRALLPLLALFAWITLVPGGAQPAAAQAGHDPIGENLFPPELLMRNQQEIGLTDEQREAIEAEFRKVQERFQGLQQDLQKEMAALADLLKQDRPDEKKALAQLDKVLDAEREIKRAQLAIAVAIKGKLTPEQLAKCRALKEKMMADARARGGGGPPESLRAKMQQFQERARKLQEDGKDLSDLRPIMEELKPLLDEGKFKEAEATLDKAIKVLDEAEKK